MDNFEKAKSPANLCLRRRRILTDAEIRHSVAEFDYNSASFVSDDHRLFDNVIADVAVHEIMNVRTAYPDALYFD